MTTIRDCTYAWGDIHNAFVSAKDQDLFPKDELDKYMLRMYQMLPKLLDALEASARSITMGVVTTAPLGAPVNATPVERAPLKDDYSYDEFAELFEKYDRNVADSIRVWFKDVDGGFDASSPADRSSIYGAAGEYLERKSKAASAPGVAQSGQRKPYVVAGDKPKRKNGPCPDCDNSRLITTKYGQRYRCDDHDWWGNA